MKDFIDRESEKTAERIAAIEAAVTTAKKRLARIDALRSVGASTRSHEFERDQLLELIRKGERLVSVKT